jgi:hypothetical protein
MAKSCEIYMIDTSVVKGEQTVSTYIRQLLTAAILGPVKLSEMCYLLTKFCAFSNLISSSLNTEK